MPTSNDDKTPALVPEAPVVPTPDDVMAAVEQGRRALFGGLAIAAEVLARSLAESVPTSPDETRRIARAATRAADTVLGIGWWASATSTAAVSAGVRRTRPLLTLVLEPPLLPARFSPRARVQHMTEAWIVERPDSVRSLAGVATTVTRTADGMVRPLVPVDAVVARLLDLVDIDLLLQEVIARTDLEAALTAALERIDLAAVVVDQVDLAALAEAVIEGIDLPAIVRQSSASMATETVDTVRLQGIDADRAVARLVDRMLHRRAPGER